MQIVKDIFPIVMSLIALYFGFQSHRGSKIAIVKEFFLQGDSTEHKMYRKHVYDIYNRFDDNMIIFEELINIQDEIAFIVSYYDFWALMVEKSYLPLWTFNGMPGKTAKNIFQKIKPYLEERRKSESEYAAQFENLIRKINKYS